jgi:UDP-N-acetylmuramoyl-tripeptide--D-alanyl-D-alanine ligase
MESSNSLYKIINTVLPFADFTYILQQEEYSLQRFNFWFWRFFFRRNIQKREELKYTQRAKSIILSSIVIWIVFIFKLKDQNIFSNIIVFIISVLLIPVFTIIANIITTPFYENIKNNIIKKSKTDFDSKRGNCKVIAITGSFGKTTLKNYLFEVLRYQYKTILIPGNINSTIGIANWLKENFKAGTEILITEIDSYKRGRIKNTTLFLNPDISIITNIGDQHLQRFKTKENLAKSLYELFDFSPQNSLKLATEETALYLEKIKLQTSDIKIVHSYNTETKKESDKINLGFVKEVADYFKIKNTHLEYIIKNKLQTPDRRQKDTLFEGFSALDDSYNISLTTARLAINESLKKAKESGKKLLVITAGIPELGKENEDSNIKLGMELNKADKVYLLESIFYKDIVAGSGMKTKFVLIKDFKSAKEKIKIDLNHQDWFVLILPELTDLYY